VSYEARFETPPKKWTTVRIPFGEFRAVFRGVEVSKAAPLDIQRIRTFGFLISEKQAGPFRLEIDWVKAYREISER